jgi:hypothetical protein
MFVCAPRRELKLAKDLGRQLRQLTNQHPDKC